MTAACRHRHGRLLPIPPGEGRGDGAHRGFTLTELLVAIAVILALLALVAGAASAARTTAKVNATRQMIDKLDGLLRQQLAAYDTAIVPMPGSLPAGFTTNAEYRAWFIRRNLISADLPDRWSDVSLLLSGTTVAYHTVVSGTVNFPLTPIQRSHAAVLRSSTSTVTDQYGDAECLFMIVMRSGVSDCVDCGSLQMSNVGDVDGDGMPEFLDAWGNPIGFILWPAGVQLPVGANTLFFSGDRPLMTAFPGAAGPSPTPTLGMLPLVYSAGPDGKYSINVGTGSNLGMGNDCGNPANATVAAYGALNLDPADSRGDNITNLDAEARR